MATPSKLDILRAAGKVQQGLAKDAAGEVVADVHPPATDIFANVTSRCGGPGAAAVDPVDQISRAQDELQDVNAQLGADRDLLQHLRGASNPDTETEFEEEFADAEDAHGRGGIDDDVGPPPTQDRVRFNLGASGFPSSRGTGTAAPEAQDSFSPEWLSTVIGAAVAAATSAMASSSTPTPSSSLLRLQAQALGQEATGFLGVSTSCLVPAV